MSDQIQRPWALMRHHAGWADVFHVDSETADSITGFYPDRETVGPPVNYSTRAVLARYSTLESARAAREGAVSEWRKHDAAVRDQVDVEAHVFCGTVVGLQACERASATS